MFASSLFFGAITLCISNHYVYQKLTNLTVIFVNPHTVEEENLYFVALTEVYL